MVADTARTVHRGAVRPYDFRFPDKFPKEQLRQIHHIHDAMGRALTTTLSGLLRAAVHISEPWVEQRTYQEFLRDVHEPAILAIFRADPLPGNALLEIDPHVGFVMIDRMLGGPGEATDSANRPVTEIELVVVQRVVTTFLNTWREAWGHIAELHVKAGGIETNPLFAQVSAPNDIVLVITVSCQVGRQEGDVRLCLPFAMLEPLLGRLGSPQWEQREATPDGGRNRRKIAEQLTAVTVPASVELGSVHLSLARVLELGPGDVLSLGVGVGDPVPLRVHGQIKYLAKVGRRGSRLAAVITSETQ